MKKIIISEKLKTYRIENKVTQQQIADLIGVTSQSISKWEREESYPDIAVLPLLAQTIGCKVDDFFT